MKRIQYHQYGGAEVMQLQAFELGRPGKGQVVVKPRFAAINPIDWKMRNGVLKIVTGRKFPRAMGMDLSGVVTAVGDGVTRFKVGDAVFGLARFKECGAFGEEVMTDAVNLAKKPDSVSFEHAACVPTVGLAAWNGLVDKAKLKKGQHVFVTGCAGSLGQAAVQLAQLLGATVSGSCSAASMAYATSLGVKHVYDYRTTTPADISERFDVIFDTANVMTLKAASGLLHKDGVLLDVEPDPMKFLRALLHRRFKLVVCTPNPDILDRLAAAVEDGKFAIPVGEVVRLEDAIQLIAEIEAGKKLAGKGLIAIA